MNAGGRAVPDDRRTQQVARNLVARLQQQNSRRMRPVV